MAEHFVACVEEIVRTRAMCALTWWLKRSEDKSPNIHTRQASSPPLSHAE